MMIRETLADLGDPTGSSYTQSSLASVTIIGRCCPGRSSTWAQGERRRRSFAAVLIWELRPDCPIATRAESQPLRWSGAVDNLSRLRCNDPAFPRFWVSLTVSSPTKANRQVNRRNSARTENYMCQSPRALFGLVSGYAGALDDGHCEMSWCSGMEGFERRIASCIDEATTSIPRRDIRGW